jgi:hypothetical protein
VPPYINDGHAFVTARISPGTDADMLNPNPDPGEEYRHVNTQLYSIVDPPDNAFRTASFMVAPWNNPAPGQTPTMDGFVQDYCNNFVATKKRNPTFDEYRVIMTASARSSCRCFQRSPSNSRCTTHGIVRCRRRRRRIARFPRFQGTFGK